MKTSWNPTNNSHEQSTKCVTLGFRRVADENCALLGYYAASRGSFLQTFRDNLSMPSSRAKS